MNADVMSQLAQSTLPGDPAMTSGDDGDSTARAPSVVALPEPGDVGMELVAPDVSLAPVNTAMMSWDEEILLEWWQVRHRFFVFLSCLLRQLHFFRNWCFNMIVV